MGLPLQSDEESGALPSLVSLPSPLSTSSLASTQSGLAEKQSAPNGKHAVSATDWTGPDDEGNPRNWSLPWKIHHTATPSAITAVATFATSAITPGLSDISKTFDVSQEAANVAFVIYLLGLGIGGVLASPCSETFGRKVVYMVSVPAFALFILGTGFSQNLATLIVTRFFAGLFGSANISVGPGTISDLWAPSQRSVPMAAIVVTPFLGPTLAPLIGGYLVERMGWRWTSWVVLFFVALVLAPTFAMRETYKRVILTRRAARLGLAAPPSPYTDRSRTQAARYFVATTLQRPLHMLVTEPVVAAFSGYVAFNFALLYAFFTAFPYVYRSVYGFGLGSTGLTFLGTGAGCVVGLGILLLNDRLVDERLRRREQRRNSSGENAPEHHLGIAMLGSMLLPVSLFLFGWTAQNRVFWLVPVIAEGMFGCGNLLIFMAATMYIMDFYGPLYGASAMAANTMLRYLAATAFPLFSVQMYKGLGIGWASSLLGFVSLGLAGIPWLFYFCGHRLRERSGYRHGTG